MTDVKYSICITHFNMVETVQESLKSILSQIDHQYEVMVVDAGSNDGSLDILKEMDRRGDIRLIIEEGCKVGEGWNIGAQKAKGDYLLLKLDADDYFYEDVIPNFVEIFHQIENEVEQDFFLSSPNLNITRRELFLELGGFRDLRVEDKDFWRRLMDQNKVIHLYHKPVCEQTGSYKSVLELLKRDFWTKYSEIRSGVRPLSIIKWHLFSSFDKDGNSRKLIPWNISSVIAAYILLKLKGEKTYKAPEKYRDYSVFRNSKSLEMLEDIEEELGFKIDRSSLSEETKKRYCLS